MTFQAISTAALTAFMLVACGPNPQPDNATAAMSAIFSVDPARMSGCTPVVATLQWDLRSKHPAVANVEIFVGPDSAPTLFAAGSHHGEARTGQWTAPGAIFRLHDKATGNELERATVSGPACN